VKATGGVSATGGSSSTGGASTGGASTGGAKATGGASTCVGGATGTGGASTCTQLHPRNVKLWRMNYSEDGTYVQTCVSQTADKQGNYPEATCTTADSYCYVTLPNSVGEDWDCHLDVDSTESDTTYLPGRDSNGTCVNDWDIMPYSGGFLVQGTDWDLLDVQGKCVFRFYGQKPYAGC